MHDKNDTIPDESNANESLALKIENGNRHPEEVKHGSSSSGSSSNDNNNNHGDSGAEGSDTQTKEEAMKDSSTDAEGDVVMKEAEDADADAAATTTDDVRKGVEGKEVVTEDSEKELPVAAVVKQEAQPPESTPQEKEEKTQSGEKSSDNQQPASEITNKPAEEDSTESEKGPEEKPVAAAETSKVKPDNSTKTGKATEGKPASELSEVKPTNGDTIAAPNAVGENSPPPPPVMRGTLSYNTETRRHIMRGMWNYEASADFQPQRFELLRNLDDDEQIDLLPQDGTFHGSFSLAYKHMTSKGILKEKSKVYAESGVQIKFKKISDSEYVIAGEGSNAFGAFEIFGKAKPSEHEGDPVWNVEFRKKYAVTSPPSAPTKETTTGSNKSSTTKSAEAAAPEPLPDPSPMHDTPGIICLRGTIVKHSSTDLGSTEITHRITGCWAAGLKPILDDPTNANGMLSEFFYEHKSTVPTSAFPVSGRYSGWFNMLMEDGNRSRINESNVSLRFKENNAGYHNVEGKGSNVYGRYTITGTLSKDNVLTIFRHFAPRKVKASSSIAPTPSASAPTLVRRASSAAIIENPQLKLEDVTIPDEATHGQDLAPIAQPVNGTYSAVSRGVLRINDDGSHSCNGKWAITREHFTGGQTSNFTIRLDALYAVEARESAKDDQLFPLDSAMYKGSFQLKRPNGKSQTIVDQQVVMRFRKNSQGSYNVYGQGINAIGGFNLNGTLIMTGKTGGQVELYRMYPPELITAPPASAPTAKTSAPAASQKSKPSFPSPPSGGLSRRESTRTVKLPSRLEDDDPTALLGRIIDQCAKILRLIREKDVETGAFFSDPVDPVALGIPTYHQIITEPMDLRTIARRMEGNEINSPEEFARLTRLVFQNAIRFNENPTHAVHQAARTLLIQFNQKFRDVERLIQKLKPQDEDKKESKKKKKQEPPPKPKTVREIRYEEAQNMAQAFSQEMTSLVAAAQSDSASVSRTEFSMLLRTVQGMQNQIVQQQRLIAELSPDVVVGPPDVQAVSAGASAVTSGASARVTSASPEKKKSAKRKADAVHEATYMADQPLTFEEQQWLTQTINDLPLERQAEIVRIIQESAPVGTNQDEIDMDIDQLSASTQRKLMSYIAKFTKKPKSKAKRAKTSPGTGKGKGGGSRKSTPVPPPVPAPAPAPAPVTYAAKSATSSLFGLGDKDDSSDSDSDDDQNYAPAASSNGVSQSGQAGGKQFSLNSDALMGGDDDDDDEDGEIGFGGSGWTLSKPEDSSNDMAAAVDDDAWNAARKSAEESKAFEEQRKAREAKMKAEAEEAKKQRMLDAAQRGEEIRAQRQEEEAREAALRAQKEKEAEEARQAAREAARAQVEGVEQTVDLDAQRDIMAQYEQSFLDKDMGGASPSSDFGF